jgi:hypothetical protein
MKLGRLGASWIQRFKFMKQTIAAVLLAAFSNAVGAATVNWTNTAGGNWSVAANWSPNQIPGPSDDVVITTGGSYAVLLDTGPTINSLTLGGGGGQQTGMAVERARGEVGGPAPMLKSWGPTRGLALAWLRL